MTQSIPIGATPELRASGFIASSLVCCAFFASGAAALVFETLWFRQAALAFGSSVWASSLVLAGFMVGMAIGSGVAARIGERLRAPIRVFIALELCVAVSGGLLVYSLPRLSPALAALSATLSGQPVGLQLVRFVAALALLIVPSAAMGMTLPLLARGVCAWEPNFGRALGLLYGLNTAGAVLGAVMTETVLVERFGVRQSALAAAGCNVLAALLAALVAGRADRASRAPRAEVVASDGREGLAAALPWLAAGFGSGFALLGLEVVWLRCLTLFLNDTPLAFALVLVAVLAAIALGSLAAALGASVYPRIAGWAGYVALGAGLIGIASYAGYGQALQRFYQPDQDAATVLALAAPLCGPTAFASGALFTLIGMGLRQTSSEVRAVGRLALFNMLGGGLGSLAAGFVLLPWLGMERALFALLALYGVIGLWLLLRTQPRRLLLTAALVYVIGLSLFPFGDMQSRYLTASTSRWMMGGKAELASVRESVSGTLVHLVHERNGLPMFDQLATNAYSMTVNDFAARRYMKLFAYLPAALHPKLERALIVGYGIGSTAAALTADPRLRRIDVVDISRDTLDISRELRTHEGPPPLDDPRVRVHIEDGRHFLAGQDQSYDLITGEPPPPIIAGVVDLYTEEYFRLIRARLLPGGMATHWLPMMNISPQAAKAIIAAFCNAFEDCTLWHGSARNFMLMGTHAARGPVSAEQFGRLWNDPGQANEARRLGLEVPQQLGALFIGDSTYLRELTRDTPALTDEFPRRIHVGAPLDERDKLIWQWRNTRMARERFTNSDWVKRLWPADLQALSGKQFENQRLINDLLFPDKTPVRQIDVLHQVALGTPLQFPVLLLVHGNPDAQVALARASPEERARPEWRLQVAAGYLAARDFEAALPVLRQLPEKSLPLPELLEWAEAMVIRGRQQKKAQARAQQAQTTQDQPPAQPQAPSASPGAQ